MSLQTYQCSDPEGIPLDKSQRYSHYCGNLIATDARGRLLSVISGGAFGEKTDDPSADGTTDAYQWYLC